MTTGRDRDDERITALALDAARGDHRALEAWIRATQADVWRFTAHLAGTSAADDLTRETYIRAITALPTFAGRSAPRTWLLSIARRVVADHFRARSTRPRGCETITLTQLLGYSYAEAAEVCDCPIGTIRARVARAREDLLAARTERDNAV
ncbi:sigma factor [Amycolatopsis sp. MtRt-6]|uniref:sigma factor n=1 Tax=Amycolatopsis sp. MtRt-6 TaxID=2792782 RepID=UPI001A8E8604|nr:sigma factor [Amycolatopsis sp. MtRt-6]